MRSNDSETWIAYIAIGSASITNKITQIRRHVWLRMRFMARIISSIVALQLDAIYIIHLWSCRDGKETEIERHRAYDKLKSVATHHRWWSEPLIVSLWWCREHGVGTVSHNDRPMRSVQTVTAPQLYESTRLLIIEHKYQLCKWHQSQVNSINYQAIYYWPCERHK